jgi:hypothetical protein
MHIFNETNLYKNKRYVNNLNSTSKESNNISGQTQELLQNLLSQQNNIDLAS